MSQETQCQSCGAPIEPNTPAGLCGPCVAGLLDPGDNASSPQASPSPRESPSLVGKTIDHYKVNRLIAVGGMGAVYEARDQRENQTVALKRMHDSLAWNPASIARFRGEAKAAAELSHPNIVPIIEIGEDQHTPYYTMKLIHGFSLAEESNARSTTKSAAKTLGDRTEHEVHVAHRIAKIAHALHHAHSHAILHRDIKPSNILIDKQGEPYLTDFGLAKRLDGDFDLTQTGMMVGTPDYMAPEQIRDDLGQVSIATDIYSLGTVLYQQLAGTPPFRADSHVKIFQNIVNHDPKPPTSEGHRINPDLSLICLKCLQKDPNDRYKSAHDFAAELERWIHHEPLTIRPEPRRKKIVRIIRKHPIQATLAAIILLLGIFIATQHELNNRKIRREQLQTQEVNESLQRLVAKNRLDRASTLFIRSDSPAAIANLSAVVQEQASPGTDQDSLFYLTSSIDNRRFPLRICPPLQHPKQIGQLAFHPDGNHLITACFDGKVRVWDLKTGTLAIPEIDHGGSVYRVTTSPDGRHILAASYNGRARIWNFATGKPVSDWMKHDHQIDTARYSPEGRWIVTTSFDRTIKLWDARIGAPVPVSMSHPFEEYGVHVAHFIPNRDQLLTASVKGKIRIWSIPDGRLIKQIDTGENYLNEVLIDPTGRRFVNLAKPRVGAWRIEDWRKELQIVHPLPIWSAQFSSDGNRLITALQDRLDETRIWDISSGRVDGNLEFRRIRGNGLAAKHAQNRWFSIVKNQIFSWSDIDGRPTMPPIQLPAKVESITIDPLHDQLGAISAEQRVHVWTTPSSSENYRNSISPELTRAALVGSAGQSPHLFGWNEKDQTFSIEASGSTLPKIFSIEDLLEVDTMVQSNTGAYLAMRCLRHMGFRIFLYHLESGQSQIHNIKMGDLDVEFSPSDRFLLLEEAHDEARIIDTKTGKAATDLLIHPSKVIAGAFNLEESEVFTGTETGEFFRWSIATSELIEPIKQPGGKLSAIKHAPNEAQLLTVAEDGILRSWNTSGKTVLQWKTPKLGQITCAGFSHSGNQIVTATASGILSLWNAKTGKKTEKDITHEDHILNFRFTPDDRILMTVTGDHLIHFWNPESGFSIAEPLPWEGHWESVTLSRDGLHFSRSLANGRVEIRPTPGTKLLTSPPEWLPRFSEALVGMRLAGDDQPQLISWEERLEHLSPTYRSTATDPFTSWAKRVLRDNGFEPYLANP